MRVFLALLSLALVASSAPVWASGDTELDIGGQIRFRPEMKNNFNFNNDSDNDARFTGQRIRLNVKGSNEAVTSFIQLQDTRVWGSESNVGTAKETEAVDLYQVWFQINDLAGAPVDLKMGRQTLVYGSQRLLGHLGWKDEARTFDGIKASVKAGPGKIDLLVMKLNEEDYWKDDSPSSNDATYFADPAVDLVETEDQNLNGAYGMFNVAGQKLDVYYLLWTTGAKRAVTTMGGRIAGKAAAIDYTAEYVIQGGDWADGVTQEASALAIEAGYNMGPTRIGFLYAMGSGDDEADATTHKNFVFPFHTNHGHYGYMDFFSWGNMNDIALRAKTKVGKNVVKLDYHMLSLADAKGDWLNVVGVANIYDGASTYTETAAGSELDITFVHPYSANMKIVAGYSMFTPGAAVEERNGGKKDGATWGYVMLINNF
jgi:hypothetical protein